MMQGIIIGGGIGGLSTALAMQQQDMMVKVYEKSPLAEPEGAGIVLAINAMRVMDKLGLADEIYQRGNELNGMNITDEILVPLSKNVVPHFLKKYGYSNVAIHRSALRDILLKNIKPETLEGRKACVSVRERERQMIVNFDDETKAYGDYVIAADGIHSVVRKQFYPEAVVRDVKQTCWRGLVVSDLPEKYHHHAIEAWGKGKRFGFVKLDEDYVYWFAVINKHNNGFSFRADLKEELDKQFQEFAPLVRQLISDTPTARILRNDLMDLKPLKQWYAGRVCLLGDSAHATTPNLGQGACQAVEDGWEMASLMDQYKNPAYAFPAFQKKRKPKTDYVAKLSYRIGQMAHYENYLLVGMRNQVMKTMSHKFFERKVDRLFSSE